MATKAQLEAQIAALLAEQSSTPANPMAAQVKAIAEPAFKALKALGITPKTSKNGASVRYEYRDAGSEYYITVGHRPGKRS